jgi:chromosome segregation ATPase
MGGKAAAVATTAKPKRRSLAKIEKDIEEAEAEMEQLNAELADSANWRLGDKMRSLQERLDHRQTELAGFEAEWEEHAAG